MKKRILITGGTGYIGSHTCIALIEAGYSPVILDNLSNSQKSILEAIHRITGERPEFILGDTRNSSLLEATLKNQDITAVIHFAGLKSVGESVESPGTYYENNINGSLSLIHAMNKAGVKNLVFSSSAAVYGEPQNIPVTEQHPLAPTSPYGRSKLFVEQMLDDVSSADPEWKVTRLRYFNPAGAHESGLIGESPRCKPGNLVPHIARVAMGEEDCVMIYGNDYPTADGTGLRDYIHIMDLAEGHVAALNAQQVTGLNTFNLGSGQGYTVLEILHKFEEAADTTINYELRPRRAGDISISIADPTQAETDLKWKARRGLEAICRDAWSFYSKLVK
jgi:UDP-glucose 4-epimerase